MSVTTIARGATLMAISAALLSGAAGAKAQPTRIAAVERITVHGKALEGNLEGNSADRDVFVVLPPGYGKDKKRRYPVVYFLHGYFAKAENYVDMAKVVEGVTAEAIAGHEMIVVLPDSFTKHAGSMYSSSVTVGDFETFVARDLVSYVDGHYRTIGKREGRGLAGHSMGGYGTLKIGMKFAPVFTSLYAMSTCCVTPRTTTVEQARAMEAMTPEQAANGDFGARANFAAAAAWSPAPDKPPYFLDSGLRDGKLDPLVLAKWAANAPITMVAQYVPALKSMTAIALDVGNRDFLLEDDKAVHAELDRYGITHGWEIYDGDHVSGVAAQFRSKVLPFFAAHLQPR